MSKCHCERLHKTLIAFPYTPSTNELNKTNKMVNHQILTLFLQIKKKLENS